MDLCMEVFGQLVIWCCLGLINIVFKFLGIIGLYLVIYMDIYRVLMGVKGFFFYFKFF